MVEKMGPSQKQSIMELCKHLCNKYNIKTIKGHKELKSTNCPGTNYPLSEIKTCSLSLKHSIDKTYTVKPLDTLWAISRKYNTTVNNLKEKNNLKTNTIYPNQILKI